MSLFHFYCRKLYKKKSLKNTRGDCFISFVGHKPKKFSITVNDSLRNEKQDQPKEKCQHLLDARCTCQQASLNCKLTQHAPCLRQQNGLPCYSCHTGSSMDTYRAHRACGSWPTYTAILHTTQRDRQQEEARKRGEEEEEVNDALSTQALHTHTRAQTHSHTCTRAQTHSHTCTRTWIKWSKEKIFRGGTVSVVTRTFIVSNTLSLSLSHTHTHNSKSHMQVHTLRYTHGWTLTLYSDTVGYTHTCTHTHTRTHTHTHAHTHTHWSEVSPWSHAVERSINVLHTSVPAVSLETSLKRKEKTLSNKISSSHPRDEVMNGPKERKEKKKNIGWITIEMLLPWEKCSLVFVMSHSSFT